MEEPGQPFGTRPISNFRIRFFDSSYSGQLMVDDDGYLRIRSPKGLIQTVCIKKSIPAWQPPPMDAKSTSSSSSSSHANHSIVDHYSDETLWALLGIAAATIIVRDLLMR